MDLDDLCVFYVKTDRERWCLHVLNHICLADLQECGNHVVVEF